MVRRKHPIKTVLEVWCLRIIISLAAGNMREMWQNRMNRRAKQSTHEFSSLHRKLAEHECSVLRMLREGICGIAVA
jgi:DNA-binding NarL/FixJ family response regulator